MDKTMMVFGDAKKVVEDMSHHIKMFLENATRTRGRKPNGYLKLNLKDEKELALAIELIIQNQ